MGVPSFFGLSRIRPLTDQMRLSTLSEGIFLFQVRFGNLIRTRLVIDRPYRGDNVAPDFMCNGLKHGGAALERRRFPAKSCGSEKETLGDLPQRRRRPVLPTRPSRPNNRSLLRPRGSPPGIRLREGEIRVAAPRFCQGRVAFARLH